MADCEAPIHIERGVLERVEEDYHAMKAWLPAEASSILDIGCGWALIDVWLARHYGGDIDVHLLDGDGQASEPIRKERTGFREKMIAWRDRNIGMAYLSREVPTCRVYGHPPDPTLIVPCDLIISKRSWGHHYPVETYLDLADHSLRKNGRIIVDIRNETDGLKAFKSRGFRVIGKGLEVRSRKCKRFALER